MEASIWQLGGLSKGDLARRVWRQLTRGELLPRAATLSFYFLLALFPALLFVVSLFGWFAEAGTALHHDLLTYLAAVMPSTALELVSKTLDEISAGAGGGKLSFGLALALWAASSGMVAIIASLNAAYGVRDRRSFVKVRGIAIGLTLALSALVNGALLLVLFGGRVAHYTESPALAALWHVVRWLVVGACVLVAFGLVYFFGPDVEDQRWYWITPGSALGLTIWLAVSLSFRLYLFWFDSYRATYGSLGAVIVLMLWFYLSGAALLIGGDINAAIESAAAAAGRGDAKANGTRAEGETPPPREAPCPPPRPPPSLCQLWGSAQGLVAAVRLFVHEVKRREKLREP